MKTVRYRDYDYVVGALNLQNVHWTAVILDFLRGRFIVADPQLKGCDEVKLIKYVMHIFILQKLFGTIIFQFTVRKRFETWKKFQLALDGRNRSPNTEPQIPQLQRSQITHPLQRDNFNCGVFTCMIIKNYVQHGCVNFRADSKSLSLIRRNMSKAIASSRN